MRGHVYVLVNGSLPGLVKVGRTTRDPTQRARELSGATGVPTPFVIAFEQAFDDCVVAEAFVHSELERRGFREATNREFFRAPAAEVIRILLTAPGMTSGLQQSDVMNSLTIREPWVDILEEADDLNYGFDDTLQNRQSALHLYKQAGLLGSARAYQAIGDLYRYGDEIGENPELALESYAKSTSLGCYQSYLGMAAIYAHREHRDNYVKCCEKFVKGWRENDGSFNNLDAGLWNLMQQAHYVGSDYPLKPLLIDRAKDILTHHETQLAEWTLTDPAMAYRYRDRTSSEVYWLKRQIPGAIEEENKKIAIAMLDNDNTKRQEYLIKVRPRRRLLLMCALLTGVYTVYSAVDSQFPNPLSLTAFSMSLLYYFACGNYKAEQIRLSNLANRAVRF